MVDYATLNLRLNNSQFNRGIDQSDSKLGGLAAATAKFAGVVAVAYTTKKIFDFSKSLYDVALQAETLQKVFNATFKSIGKAAEISAKNFADKFGLALSTSQGLLGNVGDLLTGLDFDPRSALDMAEGVNELAVKLALFRDLDVEQTSERLTKALLGEAEGVKLLGIKVDQSSKKFREAVKVMQKMNNVTETQAKSMVILNQMLNQSKNAIKNFDTSNKGLVGQSLRLNEAWKLLKETIGSLFTEGMRDSGVLEVLAVAIKALANQLKNLGAVGVASVGNTGLLGAAFVGLTGKSKTLNLEIDKMVGLEGERNAAHIRVRDALKSTTLMSHTSRRALEQQNRALEKQTILMNRSKAGLKKSRNFYASLGKVAEIGFIVQAGLALGQAINSIPLKGPWQLWDFSSSEKGMEHIVTLGDQIAETWAFYFNTKTAARLSWEIKQQEMLLEETGKKLRKNVRIKEEELRLNKDLARMRDDLQLSSMDESEQIDFLEEKWQKLAKERRAARQGSEQQIKLTKEWFSLHVRIEGIRARFIENQKKASDEMKARNDKDWFEKQSRAKKLLYLNKKIMQASNEELSASMKGEKEKENEANKRYRLLLQQKKDVLGLDKKDRSSFITAAPKAENTTVDAVEKGTVEAFKLENSTTSVYSKIEVNTKKTYEETREVVKQTKKTNTAIANLSTSSTELVVAV